MALIRSGLPEQYPIRLTRLIGRFALFIKKRERFRPPTWTKTALAALAIAPLAMLAPQAQAGSLLQDGDAAFDAGHYQDARLLWSAAARSGDADAAFDLGLLYDLGDGVTASAATAFQWFQRAGAAGLASGQLNVAVMYDSGRGVPRSMDEAATWYARAAAQGDARAAFNLGQLYEAGQGVPRNPAVATAWYGVAAATIPVAARKATLLAAERPEIAAAPLVPPMPSWPSDGGVIPLPGAHSTTELVWRAPAEPRPVRYFLEVGALEDGTYQEVYSGYRDVSAAAVTLPGAHHFAWRVYAVAADGSAYAPGPWSRFDTATPAPG